MLVALLVPAQMLVAPQCACAVQPDYSIDRISTDLYVETNSSVHVVERQTLVFNQQAKGLVWRLFGSDEDEPVEIESVRVAQLDEAGDVTGDWVSLQLIDSDPERQGGKPGDVPDAGMRGDGTEPWCSYDASDGMMRCYFPADAGTYLVEIDYTVPNRVTVFRDVGELNWRYVQSDMPVDVHDATLHIALPVPADVEIEPNSTVKAWGHGPSDGTLSIGEDGSVALHADTVKAGHYAEAHVLFPAYWIDNLDTSASNRRTSVRGLAASSEEADWLDQSARASIWDNKVRTVFAPLVAVAALIAIATALAFGRSMRTRRWFVRIAATLCIVALAEQAFFREPVTTVILLAAAAVIAFLAVLLPNREDGLEDGLTDPVEDSSSEQGDTSGQE